MADIQKVGELEIAEDLAFQQREWKIQRIGWIVFALTIIGALLGLTGSGPLSGTSVGGEALQLRFSRFDRLESPSSLNVQLGPSTVSGDQAEFWLSNAYLDTVQIEQISPDPDSVTVGPDRTTYVFTVEQPGQPIEITFHVRHQTLGWHTGEIGLAGGGTLNFGQLVYP